MSQIAFPKRRVSANHSLYSGVFPVGNCPIVHPATNEVLIDELGRRSYTTSIAYGPTLGKNIALGYLPRERGDKKSIGITSEENRAFCENLGCYGAIITITVLLPHNNHDYCVVTTQ